MTTHQTPPDAPLHFPPLSHFENRPPCNSPHTSALTHQHTQHSHQRFRHQRRNLLADLCPFSVPSSQHTPLAPSCPQGMRGSSNNRHPSLSTASCYGLYQPDPIPGQRQTHSSSGQRCPRMSSNDGQVLHRLRHIAQAEQRIQSNDVRGFEHMETSHEIRPERIVVRNSVLLGYFYGLDIRHRVPYSAPRNYPKKSRHQQCQQTTPSLRQEGPSQRRPPNVHHILRPLSMALPLCVHQPYPNPIPAQPQPH